MNDIPVIIIEIFLATIRFIQPFFAIFIFYQCFTSMRCHQRKGQPLVMLQNMVNGVAIPVVYWENSIGRSKTADIALSDPTISRDHAVLYRRDEGWLISDTGSKAGVMVNNKRIHSPTIVNIGDVIAVGTTPLVLNKVENPSNKSKSWFFDSKIGHRTLNSAVLLLLVNIFHFFMEIQLCLAKGKLNLEYMTPFLILTVAAWCLYFLSMLVFKRTTFELETIGILLSGVGIIAISGVSLKDTITQIVAMVVGMALFCFMIWFMEIPDRVMRFRVAIYVSAIALFAFNLVLGSTIHGSRNWINLGFVTIQPSEFIKIALILVGTSTLNQLQTTKNLTEFIVFTAICVGALFLMGDFGTACIFFFTFLIIAFIRSGNVRTIIFIVSAAVIGAFIILKFKPYIADRFAVWGHAWEYMDTTGYQQSRVLSYASSGGLFGVGLGQGYLKTIFASSSDLIFGVICEEMGVLFAIIVAVSIAMLAFYARELSSKSRSTLYSIAACSAAGLLVFQSCLNIFGATDILPMTGVTLPFLSMGGSSMISVWGLLSFIKAADEWTYARRRGDKL